jgi:MinD superfamily P-loop ATPase
VSSGKGGTGKTSLVGALAALAVTEPSISGRYDLKRVAALAGHSGLPCLGLVNKTDLDPAAAQEIEQFCQGKSYSFWGCLPFEPDFTRAQVEGKTIMEYSNKRLASLLAEVWEQLQTAVVQLPPKHR